MSLEMKSTLFQFILGGSMFQVTLQNVKGLAGLPFRGSGKKKTQGWIFLKYFWATYGAKPA